MTDFEIFYTFYGKPILSNTLIQNRPGSRNMYTTQTPKPQLPNRNRENGSWNTPYKNYKIQNHPIVLQGWGKSTSFRPDKATKKTHTINMKFNAFLICGLLEGLPGLKRQGTTKCTFCIRDTKNTYQQVLCMTACTKLGYDPIEAITRNTTVGNHFLFGTCQWANHLVLSPAEKCKRGIPSHTKMWRPFHRRLYILNLPRNFPNDEILTSKIVFRLYQEGHCHNP